MVQPNGGIHLQEEWNKSEIMGCGPTTKYTHKNGTTSRLCGTVRLRDLPVEGVGRDHG